jgi:hypothetical protein
MRPRVLHAVDRMVQDSPWRRADGVHMGDSLETEGGKR